MNRDRKPGEQEPIRANQRNQSGQDQHAVPNQQRDKQDKQREAQDQPRRHQQGSEERNKGSQQQQGTNFGNQRDDGDSRSFSSPPQGNKFPW